VNDKLERTGKGSVSQGPIILTVLDFITQNALKFVRSLTTSFPVQWLYSVK
jgi:hypothetical protein